MATSMESLARLIRFISQLVPYPLTSLFGIAGCIFTLWKLLGTGRIKQLEERCPPLAVPGTVSPAATDKQQTQAEPGARRRPHVLAGVNAISISAPGVLLEETSPSDLEDSATLRPEAARLLRQVCGACGSAVVLAHVESDVGEATLRGALEAAGLLGSGRDQLRPHRLLFCGTANGKASIVRQLSPDLHVDGTAQTIVDLQRFVKRLVHVQQQPFGAQSCLPNVEVVASLAAALED